MPDCVPTVPMVMGPALLGAGTGPLGAGAEPPPGAGVGTPAVPLAFPPGDFEPVPEDADPVGDGAPLPVRAGAAPLIAVAATAGFPEPPAGANGDAPAPLATVPDAPAWSVPVPVAGEPAGVAAVSLPATGAAAVSEAGDVCEALAADACFPSLDRAPQADPIRSESAKAAIARRDRDMVSPSCAVC
jgi:hypothetical protein